MPGPANDQSLNLKHRLTGAAILIGIAVAVMSFLLDEGDPAAVSSRSSDGEKPQDSFVSRIVGSEDGVTRVPAPTRAPDEIDPRAPTMEPQDPAPRDAGSERAAVRVPEAATPEPSLEVEPVLEQATGLPGAAPKINTVEAEPVIEDDANAAAPRSAAARESVAAADAWVVRVGAFTEASNADGITRRLKAGGYAPSSAPVTINGRSMVRVWVGPYPDRKSAVRAKADLARDFDLDGFVARQP